MKQVRLVRSATNPDTGTFGMLSIDGIPQCVTLELFWRNNMRSISCIPEGAYHCVKHESREWDWRVLDVLNRSGILFHAGNTTADIEGCILFGKYVGNVNGGKGVLESKLARLDFNSVMSTENEFKLEIVNSF